MKFADNNNMHKISDEFKKWVRSNQRWQSYVPLIAKIVCEHSTGHVFSLLNFKLSQSDILDKMSVKFESGSCGVKK